MNKKIVLAVTGASGAAYAVRLLEVLLASKCDVQIKIAVKIGKEHHRA